MADVVPSSESVEELARPFDAVTDVFDPEEFEEEMVEQPGLLVVRWNSVLVNRTGRGVENTCAPEQTVVDRGVVVTEAMSEQAESLLVPRLSPVEDDHFGDELLLERLDTS